MTSLREYFQNNKGRLIHKWDHYFEIYERHFNQYVGKSVTILEIGVSHGGSLQMWKNYFGPNARIFGIDVNPACKELEEENIEIFIGSQSNRLFLRNIKDKIGKIDILIDDGGHMMSQQIISFEELFPLLSSQGVYLCEDVHTSYWLKFGGGYKRSGTFIEYAKNIIDKINAYHSEQTYQLNVDDFTRSINSIHFYDSIVVIEKCQRQKPFHLKTGNVLIEHESKVKSPIKKEIFNVLEILLTNINKILRFFRIRSLYWK